MTTKPSTPSTPPSPPKSTTILILQWRLPNKLLPLHQPQRSLQQLQTSSLSTTATAATGPTLTSTAPIPAMTNSTDPNSVFQPRTTTFYRSNITSPPTATSRLDISAHQHPSSPPSLPPSHRPLFTPTVFIPPPSNSSIHCPTPMSIFHHFQNLLAYHRILYHYLNITTVGEWCVPCNPKAFTICISCVRRYQKSMSSCFPMILKWEDVFRDETIIWNMWHLVLQNECWHEVRVSSGHLKRKLTLGSSYTVICHLYLMCCNLLSFCTLSLNLPCLHLISESQKFPGCLSITPREVVLLSIKGGCKCSQI